MTVPYELSLVALEGDGSTITYNTDITGSPESIFDVKPVDSGADPLDFGVESIAWNDDHTGALITFSAVPANMVEFLLYRSTPVYQDSGYSVYGPFPAKQAEADWDKTIRILQETQDTLLTSGSVENLRAYVDLQDMKINQRIDDIVAAQGVLARGELTISFDPPAGIPSEKAEWVQVGDVGVGVAEGEPVNPGFHGSKKYGR